MRPRRSGGTPGPFWARVKFGVRCAFGHSIERGAMARFGTVLYGRRVVTCAPCMKKHYGQDLPPGHQMERDGKMLALGRDE